MLRRATTLLLVLLAISSCKKGGTAESSDGGESASSPSGGGILSFLSGTPFEGEIALSVQDKKSGKPPTTLLYEVKQPKMRLDVPQETMTQASPGGRSPMGGKSVWMLIDPPQKKMWAVTDDEKKAIVFDLNKMSDEMKKVRGGGGSGPTGAPGAMPTKAPPKISKTGKTDKVAGYECEIWEIEEETKKISICAAKGITWFDARSMGGPFGGFDPKAALLAELTDANHFPLRVVALENGVETERMEATRIEKKKLDDARFQVPAGYQVLDLAQMFQGLGTLGGPGGVGSGRPFPGGMPNVPPRHK